MLTKWSIYYTIRSDIGQGIVASGTIKVYAEDRNAARAQGQRWIADNLADERIHPKIKVTKVQRVRRQLA